MKFYRLLIINTLMILSGCAAKHVIPPADYQTKKFNTDHYDSEVMEHIFRVAFDQHGSMYPQDSEHYLFTITPHRIKCRFVSCGWEIHSTSDPEGIQPSYDFIESHSEYKNALITRLNSSMAQTKKLVVFIHGFNSDFDAASKNFGLIRDKIDMKDITILEVYWDGLDLPVPLFPWAKALTYSNLAGQIGVRGLLNGIDVQDSELAFVTHSRGAGVAISAISDPIYDDDICAPQETGTYDYRQLCGNHLPPEVFVGDTFPRFESFDSAKFDNINLVFFAPAIGGGHFWTEMNRYLPGTVNVNFFVAANEGDYANGKVIGKPNFYGDTSLGADKEEIEKYISILDSSMPKMSLQYLFFKDGFYHGLDDYFDTDNGGLPECLLWAGQLREDMPVGCKLSRRP